jgi:CHRD domain
MPTPRVLVTLSLVLVAGVVASCGGSGSTTAGTGPVALDDEAGGGSDQAAAVGDSGTTRLTVALTGAAEVPVHGDPDGRGTATVVVEPGRSQLCYRIEVDGVEEVDGTSVHSGSAGESGGVLLGLDPPTGGSSEGCVTAEPGLLEQVGRSPERYYLNVRSLEYPDGAVRGQLQPH